jgi:hypothetical protein
MFKWLWAKSKLKTSEQVSEQRFQDALNNLDLKINDIDTLQSKIKAIKADIDERLSLIPSIPPRGEDDREQQYFRVIAAKAKPRGGPA